MSHPSDNGRRRNLRIELLEIRQLLAGDTYLVNFQNDEATTPTRYVRDVGDLFGDRGNGLSYGWSSDHVDQGRERSLEADRRLDTLMHIEAGQEWEFALDNGNYEVTVAVGDPDNNDGVHTINVEGTNFFDAVADTNEAQFVTEQVTVTDGRLTIDAGAAANKATRINFVHIVGVPDGPNAAPAAPTITEPSVDGQVVNPADVHMEAVGYSDPDGDAHKSSDWEIWTVGAEAEPVWQTLGIEGVERLHTHLGDGVFINAQAGEIELAENTEYELRVRFRDDAGAVSGYQTRTFETGASSTTFPLQVQDLADSPAPDWESVFGVPVDLPLGDGILSPVDEIVAIDLDVGTNSDSPVEPDEGAHNILDGDPGTKYLNFGELNTGFIVTPSSAAAVQSFTITTANDAADRDPASYVMYGTNDPITTTAHGNGRSEDWVEIASGSLSLPNDRFTLGDVVSFANAQEYSSYKMLFPTVKSEFSANSMQIADVRFYESQNGTGPNVLSEDDFILPIQDIDAVPTSSSPAGEGPEFAIDGNINTKYLNDGEERSGLIVTPDAGPSTVTSFQVTTANDFDVRDPTSWILYGTNDPIETENHGIGDAEDWTFIDSGTLDLPLARNTVGPQVTVDNEAGAFTSYRMVFPTVRDAAAAGSMQLAELQFFGDETGDVTPPKLRLEDGATGAPLLEIEGAAGTGNLVTDFPTLGGHADVRVVITAGSKPLALDQSNLTVTDTQGTEYTIFLPAVNLAADGRMDLWVSLAGSTYFGTPAQTEPNFSSLAREANLAIPYVTTQPGFVIEEVSSDYRLPVNIAFVPDPGPNPDDPLYYVTELYGSIQVVTRDGTKHEFATGLLDYNPDGPISGSGEQGLTGLTVQRDELNPDIYHLYVGMLWDNNDPPGGPEHYPKVERIESVAGGLEMDTRSVLLNMQPETQGQSHQISNISIGPDGLLYVHNGDGFDASTAQDLDQFRGKVLRMNLDGTPSSNNPFYDDSDGITARDYIYAYGLRNPFGGAWRASDGQHYSVENGPSVDRLAQINEGVNYGWDGSNASMEINAIYNWVPSTAPVNITFVQPDTFNGSQFPVDKMDHAFISESGPTYANGPQANGKRLTEMVLDANGELVSGPTNLVEYVGDGRSTVVALAAGPDGLYFSELYEDTGINGPTGSGARIYRVSYVNPVAGDYDIDGDVDQDDYDVWKSTYGSNLLLAADGNGNGVVDLGDYTIWRDALPPEPVAASSTAATGESQSTTDDTAPAPLAIAPLDSPGGTLLQASASSHSPLPYVSGSGATYETATTVQTALLLATTKATDSAGERDAWDEAFRSLAEESSEDDELSVSLAVDNLDASL